MHTSQPSSLHLMLPGHSLGSQGLTFIYLFSDAFPEGKNPSSRYDSLIECYSTPSHLCLSSKGPQIQVLGWRPGEPAAAFYLI